MSSSLPLRVSFTQKLSHNKFLNLLLPHFENEDKISQKNYNKPVKENYNFCRSIESVLISAEGTNNT